MIDTSARVRDDLHDGRPVRPVTRVAAPEPAFAHRVSAADVLVTGWERLGPMSFALGVDWSGPHCFFAPAQGSAHHHMLVVQTLRQAGLALAHAEFGVGRSCRFLMDELTYSADRGHRTDPSAPIRAVAEYTRLGRRSLGVHITLRQRGRTFVASDSAFTWVPAEVYARLRGPRLTARPGIMPRPVAPAAVGRTARDEVVLAPSGRPDRWELIADTGHPALVDHAVDHVPGLVLLEAAQQAAYAHAADPGFCPVATSLHAYRYVEFDAPCHLEAGPVAAVTPGAVGIGIVGRQRGAEAFRCVVEGFRGEP